MGIGKTWLPVYKLLYWVNVNNDIENAIKHCSTCLEYQNIQLHERTTPYEVLVKPWQVVGTDGAQSTKEVTL